MPRRLPALNALKAFEAAARHESFTRAAEELNVTQGAVSHQVKALEAELGLKLFNRERQRLVITEAGRAYLNVVRDAFDRIASGTERLLQRQNAGALTVSTSPNFAAKWLVHRLGRFAEAHPDIDLRVSASLHPRGFRARGRRSGDPPRRWPGIGPAHHPPLRGGALPVCSPKLLEGGHPLRKSADLSRHTLLHVNDGRIGAGGEGLWRQERRRLTRACPEPGEHGHRCGDRRPGVALARSALAAWDLIAARSCVPSPRPRPPAFAYWIVCPKANAKLPKINAFTEWLLAEAADDVRRLQKLRSKAPAGRRPV